MWFLEIDKLMIITLIAVFIGALRVFNQHFKFKMPINYILPFLEIGVLFYIKQDLAVFYLAYILVTFFLGFILHKSKKTKKLLFVLACIVACIPFFANRLPIMGLGSNSLFLIIGISYSIFKAIDVYYHIYYSGQMIDFLVYINYILFLPVFTAGPIHRYREFDKSMKEPISIDMDVISRSIKGIIRGLFKKLVIVEILFIFFNHLQTLSMSWYINLSIMIMSYLILYFDLSGYSDIAIAFGGLMGILVPENFKKPWAAPTMTQFWRNWHVTLSDYIREHIQVVVVKKRLTKVQGGLIGFFTMIIMSLWHGFNIAYFLAGIFLGSILFLENIFSLTRLNKRTTNKVHFALRCLLTNFLFSLNTLVFTLPKEKVIEVILGLFKV